MTKTEEILRKMNKPPKAVILVGGRSEEAFLDEFFKGSEKTDIRIVENLVSEEVSAITSFSSLKPRGEYRVVCIKRICGARKDNQSTLLKLIEDSPEYTCWVLSAQNLDAVLKPVLSRSFTLDWVSNKSNQDNFHQELVSLVQSKSYLGIFKLHSRITDEAGGDMERTKELHINCLSQLANLLPASHAAKVLKVKNGMNSQLRTEIPFKSVLLEVLL